MRGIRYGSSDSTRYNTGAKSCKDQAGRRDATRQSSAETQPRWAGRKPGASIYARKRLFLSLSLSRLLRHTRAASLMVNSTVLSPAPAAPAAYRRIQLVSPAAAADHGRPNRLRHGHPDWQTPPLQEAVRHGRLVLALARDRTNNEFVCLGPRLCTTHLPLVRAGTEEDLPEALLHQHRLILLPRRVAVRRRLRPHNHLRVAAEGEPRWVRHEKVRSASRGPQTHNPLSASLSRAQVPSRRWGGRGRWWAVREAGDTYCLRRRYCAGGRYCVGSV